MKDNEHKDNIYYDEISKQFGKDIADKIITLPGERND